MKRLVVATIKLYQRTLSPDHGWFSGGVQHVCRFQPTCSQYTIEAVEKYGVIKGLGKGSWRILRCNPWNKGGFDPLK
jgi:uncharacterized protein